MQQTERTGWLGAAAAAAILAIGLAHPARAQEEVKIGLLFEVTGPIANFIPPLIDSANLVADQVNANGGILGKKLKLVVADAQGTAQGAVDAASKLANVESVPIIVGSLTSGATMAAANAVAIPQGVTMISPTSTTPQLTTLDKKDLVFRIVPSDTYQGLVLADVLLDRGIKDVALTYVNNDYGVGVAENFRKAYTAKGGKITADQVHEPQKSSYRSELATLASGKSKTLVLIAYAGDSGLTILRQSLENGFFDSFIGTDGLRDNLLFKEIGSANLKGMFGTSPTSAPDTDGKKRFTTDYVKAYKSAENKLFIEQVYDATMMAALAIQQAGSTDRKRVHDGLRAVGTDKGETILPGEWAKAVALLKDGKTINYQGAAGPHVFDTHGDVAGYIGEWVVDGDNYKEVKVYAPK